MQCADEFKSGVFDIRYVFDIQTDKFVCVDAWRWVRRSDAWAGAVLPRG